MQVIKYPSKEQWSELLKRPVFDFGEIEARVSPILASVRNEGDAALRRFALDFDNILLNEFEVSKGEIESQGELISQELKAAIGVAYKNILKFHTSQKEETKVIETMPGVECWRKQIGIDRVGIYIPGGTAPLFSTVLMLAIPAKLAGCREIILCSPSNHPAIYYAAKLAGVDRVFRVGGAQAVAALAYGTETIPKVDKIFGPGNQYVTIAKQLVSKEGVAIDMPAGPSEVAVFADDSANASFVAADLLSQAEHGVDSQVILISTSDAFIQKVNQEIGIQVQFLTRRDIALKSLENSKAIIVNSSDEGIELLNEYAAEHLILATNDAEELAERIINAGSIFIGHYTPESCGDYASGTNHTLPTNGFAKAYSGVSLDSFSKKITFQKISKTGLKNLGPSVETMANAEGLDGHAQAVSIRLKNI